MRKRSVSVEWHVAESEEEWQALRHERERAISSQRSSLYRWLASLFLIGLLSFGLWQWQQTLPEAAATAANGAAMPDGTATPEIEDSLVAATLEPSTAVAARGDLFNNEVARMLERPEWGIHAYQTVDESLRPVLANALWGAEQELVTPYFHFYFRQRDAQTVTTAAPQLDQIYQELWQSWGLSTSSRNKLVVLVSERYMRSDLPYLPQHVAQLTVSSPALYPEIAPWTATDLFTQSVVLLLVDQLLADAIDSYAIGTARDPMLDGLRLWQHWDLMLPLAEPKTALLYWLYVDLPNWQPGTDLPLPENYDRLCVLYTLWMTYPAQLHIPLLCAEQDQSPLRFAPEVVNHPPQQLPWLNVRHYLDEEADGQLRIRDTRHPGETLALAMFVDYLVTTHGRAKLPKLLANLNRYRTWEELLPAVYGVSKESAETEWKGLIDCSIQRRQAACTVPTMERRNRQ
ncbi:MAG: hypothetical protein KDE31_18050, partial [Caldilineaceae bacterium]|nr:hypothetical protein [Caldilineaceae bacterium]